MRRGFSILLCTIVVLLMLPNAAVTSAETALPLGDAVDIPAELIEWLKTAEDASPALRALQRKRAMAQSDFRSGLQAVEGQTTQFESKLEANEKGVGLIPAISFQLTQGATSLHAGLGAAPTYTWRDEKFNVVPNAFLSLRHELGAHFDVGRQRVYYEYDEAEYEYSKAKQQWVLDVTQTYAAWHVAVIDLQLAEQNLVLAEAQYAQALDRAQAGAVSQNALYAAQYNVTEAEQSVARAEHQLAKVSLAFQDMLGFHVEPLFHQDNTFAIELSDLPKTDDTNEWFTYAREHRIDLQLAEHRLILANKELAHAERQQGLTGRLTGDVTVPASSSDDEATVGWRVGATVELPLYNPKKEEDVVRAQLRAEQAKEDIQYREQKMYDEIHMAWWSVQLAEQNYERQLHALERAEQTEKAMQRASDEGVGSTLDVQAATLHVAEAKRSVLRAQYDKLIEQVSFLYVLGRDLLQ